MDQLRLENGPTTTTTTLDEASLERSKGFVKALQELKNLRPQLYSAAEYCEKSYLHSEQKQMVLDNLKDYAVRALINAVDHLGTVSYKLTDILDQQTSEVDSTEMKVRCLSQQLLTCQTYTDKEGLRQQQLLAIIPRHHKRYILPSSVSKRVHFSPTVQTNPRQLHSQARPRVNPAGTPGSKTLSWHLASETTTPNSKATQNSAPSSEVEKKTSVKSSSAFHLLENDEFVQSKSATTQPKVSSRNLAPSGLTYKDGPPLPAVVSRPPLVRSFQNTANVHNQIIRAPPRTKSMLSAFFVKQKASKLKPGTVV